ncbi:hypothetical protein MML48_3g00011099 [Holotrichia oblita]|uniref:Uncharacterized protein n=1 Tax=Holotrichia oblita TaxID=644536 RepID=A0ACB9TH83_HOLOL|nr:hypothetical protein MML48_3g00011099 [Holotrichia oblita]
MTTEQKEIKKEIQQVRKEQKQFHEGINKLKMENEKLKEQYETIVKENSEIKRELADVKGNIEKMEKLTKRNNIVLKGLEMKTNDPEKLKTTINKFIAENIGIEATIKAVNKVGGTTCIVELIDEETKTEIMRNKAKLRNMEIEKIYINEDLTRKDRDKQRQLRIRAQEERGKGNIVKVGYNKLIINEKEWRWNKEKEVLEKKITKN